MSTDRRGKLDYYGQASQRGKLKKTTTHTTTTTTTTTATKTAAATTTNYFLRDRSS